MADTTLFVMVTLTYKVSDIYFVAGRYAITVVGILLKLVRMRADRSKIAKRYPYYDFALWYKGHLSNFDWIAHYFPKHMKKIKKISGIMPEIF